MCRKSNSKTSVFKGARNNTNSNAKKKEWVVAKLTEAEPYRILLRRSDRGIPMRVAYEDVRIAPKGELTQELLARTLEEESGEKDTCEKMKIDEPSGRAVDINEEGSGNAIPESHPNQALLANKETNQQDRRHSKA